MVLAAALVHVQDTLTWVRASVVHFVVFSDLRSDCCCGEIDFFWHVDIMLHKRKWTTDIMTVE